MCVREKENDRERCAARFCRTFICTRGLERERQGVGVRVNLDPLPERFSEIGRDLGEEEQGEGEGGGWGKSARGGVEGVGYRAEASLVTGGSQHMTVHRSLHCVSVCSTLAVVR